MIVRIRGESKLRPRAVRVPVPSESESGSWTVPGWGPPVRVSGCSFLEWVPGPGRYRKPTLPVQASPKIRAKRVKRFCKFCCFFARPLKVRAFLKRYNMGQKHQNRPFPVILQQCFSIWRAKGFKTIFSPRRHF